MDDTKIAVEQKYQFGKEKNVSSKERKKVYPQYSHLYYEGSLDAAFF